MGLRPGGARPGAVGPGGAGPGAARPGRAKSAGLTHLRLNAEQDSPEASIITSSSTFARFIQLFGRLYWASRDP